MTATITALADRASMREITIGIDGVRLPTDGANLVEFVEAIATADPGLALLRWVDTRFAGTDLLAIHTQVVHMESLADEPQAEDGVPGHVEWLDRWACAESELRDLYAETITRIGVEVPPLPTEPGTVIDGDWVCGSGYVMAGRGIRDSYTEHNRWWVLFKDGTAELRLAENLCSDWTLVAPAPGGEA